jgi:sporulation protein YlmC with PRC-barrel domain
MADQHAAADTRFEIRTGVLVVAMDGEVGRTDGVVVDPETGEVEGLVIRAVVQLGRDLLIPIDAVADAKEDLVRLRLTRGDLMALPSLDQLNFTRPAPEWPFSARHRAANALIRRPGSPVRGGLRPGEPDRLIDLSDNVKLRPGQTVVNAEGEVGPLDLVLLDATTGQVSCLVVRRGGLAGQATLVPPDLIGAVRGDQIVLDATREQLCQLPEYRPDDAITDAVQGILWYRSDLPRSEVRNVTVRTVNGVVELEGYAATERGRAAIEALVREVAGVLGVRNNLHTFEGLSDAVQATEQRRNPAAGSRQVGPE